MKVDKRLDRFLLPFEKEQIRKWRNYLLSIPFWSFCWNSGRVENIRQRVETTTNMQETTATTCNVSKVKESFLDTNTYIQVNERQSPNFGA